MKDLCAALFCLVFWASLQLTQPAFAAQQAQNTSATSQSAQQAEIEAVLKKYAEAYQYRNIDGLVAVWPGLKSQEKQYKKTKEFFEDVRISDPQMLVKPLDWQLAPEQVIVRCERVEQYLKIHITPGLGPADIMPATAVHATTFPDTVYKKKVTVHSEVWITLRRSKDNWVILAVDEKQPH
jgi:hypothetical protein